MDITTEQYGRRSSHGIGQFLIDNREFDPSFNPEYREYKKMADELEAIVAAGQKGVANVKFEDALLGALNQLAALGIAFENRFSEEKRARNLCQYSDLESMTIAEIKTLAGELGYTLKATKKADIISEFLAQQE